MNEVSELVIRRILVALDASAASLAALEEAAEWAAILEADLMGLFVEDINLVRIAGLPLVRQISYPSGAEEPVSSARMELELKLRGERARKALAVAAERRHRPWSFRVVRGDVTAEILAAALGADLLLLGKAGWSPARLTGSTALAVAAAAPGALLLIQPGKTIREPVMTVYDGSEDSFPALRASVHLASVFRVGLVVFVMADTPERGAQMESEARRIVNAQLKDARFRQLTHWNARQFSHLVKGEGNGLLVLPGSSRLAQDQALRTLLEETSNPVLLTRQPHVSGRS